MSRLCTTLSNFLETLFPKRQKCGLVYSRLHFDVSKGGSPQTLLDLWYITECKFLVSGNPQFAFCPYGLDLFCIKLAQTHSMDEPSSLALNTRLIEALLKFVEFLNELLNTDTNQKSLI